MTEDSDFKINKTTEKARKLAGDDTVDALLAMPTEELCDRIVSLAQHERDTEDSRADDEGLNDLKEQVKAADGPYRDQLKAIKVQRTLISLLIDKRGKTAKSVSAQAKAAE